MPLFGSHLSIAGGLYKAVDAAAELGMSTVQIFTHSPSQWSVKPVAPDSTSRTSSPELANSGGPQWQGKLLADEDIRRFREAIERTGIQRPCAHDSYLINLATPDDALWHKSVEAIVAELHRAESLGLHGVLPIAALGVVFGRTGHLGAGLLAVLILRALALFCYDFKRVRREARADDREANVARLAANVPCYFIAHMLGCGSLGIFAAIAAAAPVANGLVHGLGQAVSPKLNRLYADGDRRGFSQMSVQMGGTGVLLGLCGVASAIIGGPWVLGKLFGAEYAGQPALLLALSAVAGGTFVATLLGCTLTAGRRGGERAPLEIAAVTATALACVALVPRAGLPGAACAAGFGCLVHITGQLWVLHSILRRPRKPALLALLKAPLAQ